MILKNRSKTFFKMISIVVAGIFLWNQVVWAGDLAAGNTASLIEGQDNSQPAGVDPEYLQGYQARQLDLIGHKEDIEGIISDQYLSATMSNQPALSCFPSLLPVTIRSIT